jgi:hypothetical protein
VNKIDSDRDPGKTRSLPLVGLSVGFVGTDATGEAVGVVGAMMQPVVCELLAPLDVAQVNDVSVVSPPTAAQAAICAAREPGALHVEKPRRLSEKQ